MKGKKIIIAALTASTLLTLTACGSKDNGTSTGNNTGTNSNSSSSTKVVSDLGVQPGGKVKYDTPWEVVGDLSPKCTEAVSDIRALEKKYPGESVPKSEWLAMNNSMKAAIKNCDIEEFNRWYKDEFTGWSHSTKLKS